MPGELPIKASLVVVNQKINSTDIYDYQQIVHRTLRQAKTLGLLLFTVTIIKFVEKGELEKTVLWTALHVLVPFWVIIFRFKE